MLDVVGMGESRSPSLCGHRGQGEDGRFIEEEVPSVVFDEDTDG